MRPQEHFTLDKVSFADIDMVKVDTCFMGADFFIRFLFKDMVLFF